MFQILKKNDTQFFIWLTIQNNWVYRDKILSIEQAATKSWLKFTTDKLKSKKLIR